MGRLIDADANRDEFMEEVYDILSDEPDNIKANLIIDAFDEIPTAYDPDKVVEQLENRKSLMLETFKISESDIDRGRIYGMDKVIEIVKAGGADEM